MKLTSFGLARDQKQFVADTRRFSIENNFIRRSSHLIQLFAV